MEQLNKLGVTPLLPDVHLTMVGIVLPIKLKLPKTGVFFNTMEVPYPIFSNFVSSDIVQYLLSNIKYSFFYRFVFMKFFSMFLK